MLLINKPVLARLLGFAALTASCDLYAAGSCASSQRYEGAPPRPAVAPALFPDHFATSSPLSPAQVAGLESVLDEAQSRLAPLAMTAAIVRESGAHWSTTRVQSGPLPPMFYWASVGKAWIAIAILQLVEEGKLRLSDRLDQWAPEFPDAHLISIEHLLTHTSGLFSFQEDAGLRTKPGFKPRDEVLRVARSHPPLFCPGRTWAYSNTGYVLLGLIIERLDARPLDQALTARIVDRLGLEATRVLGPDVAIDGIAPPVPPDGSATGTGDDLRTPGAAGAIAGSAADMARFWAAALTGQLTSTQSARDLFSTLYPMPGQAAQFYGRGVMFYDVPASPNTPADQWLGHSGGLPGATAVVAWSTRTRSVVAVAVTGQVPAEAVANRLLATLD